MDGIDPLERLAIVAEQKEAREQKLLQQAEKQAKVMAWYYVGVAVVAVIAMFFVTSKINKMKKNVMDSAKKSMSYRR